MYTYSSQNASTYAQLGIAGTTYEPSFNELAKLLGNLKDKTVMDFGCGAGRSTRFLKSFNPVMVYGVDHSAEMIAESQSANDEGIEYQVTGEIFPFSDNFFDVVISTFVFVETPSIEKMLSAAKEIYRVLKPSGQFLISTGNSQAFIKGANYKNFSYPPNPDLKSGMKTRCTVKGEQPFVIDDIYWTENDYEQVLTQAGFSIRHKSFPAAEGDGWLDETKITPHLVYECVKSTK